MLIASRSQIECKALGGGYVNNWSTESFARYMGERDPQHRVLLCRDHGGPRQHPLEVDLSEAAAMVAAQESLAVDVEAGFDIFHLDVSLLPLAARADAFVELYAFVSSLVSGRDIAIEIGWEEQSANVGDLDEFARFAESLCRLCSQQSLVRPLFVVAQTGTLVDGLHNVGEWSRSSSVGNMKLRSHVSQLCQIAAKCGMYVKEHNADYLPAPVLGLRSSLGIGAVNIAPQIGVYETKLFLRLARSFGCHSEADTVLQLAYDSGLWRKWFSDANSSSDYDKAIAAGHYIFGTPEFAAISRRVLSVLKRNGVSADDYITEHLSQHIIFIARALSPEFV